MARRYIHYEAAFEDYLRSKGLPYIAIDEAKRSIFAGSKVKSFDFIVYQDSNKKSLVDVKGRKFPYDTDRNRRIWENWVSLEDLDDLEEWERVFGEGFTGLFVFAYWMTGPESKWPFENLHRFRGETYAFFRVNLSEYKLNCTLRSPKWKTMTIPTRKFKEIIETF